MNIIAAQLILFYSFNSVKCLCFFPAEYQGIFAAQSSLTQGKRHIYTEVTILPEAIPIWGVCESRVGNTVILMDTTGGHTCARCFHLYLRSPNVIQIYTEGIDRCHDNVKSAKKSCPSMQDIRRNRAREIMLYKKRSFNQDGRISREMCPFVGRFHFSYGAFDGKRRSDMCLDLSSHLSSCPRASQLKLSFRDCTFGDLDLHLECLGSWTGFDDITYLALYDLDVKTDTQPRYRCGMYHKSPSGRVALSLSVDSSCHNQLVSPWQGFESLNLTPFRPPALPPAIFGRSCTFPNWTQGEWQNVKFTGNEFEYRDETTDQIHRGICLSEESPQGERFSLYTVNQCDREMFSCIWLKKRSHNVLEFILSTTVDTLNASHLCSDDHMWRKTWITQARKLKTEASCPIVGDFIGVIPDDRSLCAKLTTDCMRPDFLHHTVFPCNNESLALEDRYYQCLGGWEEGGVTYIYTWRRDVYNYECFAGVKVSEDQVFLMEAGSTCRRGLQPLAEGMKINKKGDCSESESSSFYGEYEDHDVSNRVEGYDKNDGPTWSRLGENSLPLSSGTDPSAFLRWILTPVITVSILVTLSCL